MYSEFWTFSLLLGTVFARKLSLFNSVEDIVLCELASVKNVR